MPFDTVTANSILNWALGKGTLTTKSKVYIGLCSNDPVADGGTIEELSGNGYHRVLVAQYNETYPDFIGTAAERAITNPKQIAWTKATGDWVAVQGIFLTTSETGGTPYWYGKLSKPVTTVAGAVFLFDPNTLTIDIQTEDVTIEAATVE